MNARNKRMNIMNGHQNSKKIKKECSYGEACYRMNPAHFREFCHPHLEAILVASNGTREYRIPDKYSLQRSMIIEQLNVMVEKKLYESIPDATAQSDKTLESCQLTPSNERVTAPMNEPDKTPSNTVIRISEKSEKSNKGNTKNDKSNSGNSKSDKLNSANSKSDKSNSGNLKSDKLNSGNSKSDKSNSGNSKSDKSNSEHLKSDKTYGNSSVEKTNKIPSRSDAQLSSTPDPRARVPDSEYRPVVPPTRRAEDYLRVVRPPGAMLAKHAAAAPYYLFYSTITACERTHTQPYSITFQELLDPSLGELRCSLQINFMVEPGWLLAHYYFAGYSAKRLTILYGEECDDMKQLSKSKPHVEAVKVHMGTPFGKHHTKLMVLCYEDCSLRVVVSTANLYADDWENRTQGLWFSERCAPLPSGAPPTEGESRTGFKRSLLRYLQRYHLPQLQQYVRAVESCDFTHVNVFLVASVPGSHFDSEWGMLRVGSLLRQHCSVPAAESSGWPLVAQASSIGSFGADPKLWLTGDFLHNFTKSSSPSQVLTQPPPLQLIYPSLENVRGSHDGLLGGGCLPYAASAHVKQPWLNGFLHQWVAQGASRSRAMPHVKSYVRACGRSRRAAFFLLTSANVSKAAWGCINKGNRALRLMSYEAGVLLLPGFVIDEEFFPLEKGVPKRLVLPYDLPPTKYTGDMSPWVSDYLH